MRMHDKSHEIMLIGGTTTENPLWLCNHMFNQVFFGENASIFLNFIQIHRQTWLAEANHC